ncbi:MAG: hypothetical protein RugAbin2_02422 [Rugosibacter sp.]|nr:hypothetical protein [Rugosibacter sp.]
MWKTIETDLGDEDGVKAIDGVKKYVAKGVSL